MWPFKSRKTTRQKPLVRGGEVTLSEKTVTRTRKGTTTKVEYRVRKLGSQEIKGAGVVERHEDRGGKLAGRVRIEDAETGSIRVVQSRKRPIHGAGFNEGMEGHELAVREERTTFSPQGVPSTKVKGFIQRDLKRKEKR